MEDFQNSADAAHGGQKATRVSGIGMNARRRTIRESDALLFEFELGSKTLGAAGQRRERKPPTFAHEAD